MSTRAKPGAQYSYSYCRVQCSDSYDSHSLRAVDAVPRGVYVIPSAESLSRWDGVLFIHGGPYGGSILKFLIIYEQDFPKSAPKIRFITDVYHRMFIGTGYLDMMGEADGDSYGGSKDESLVTSW